MAASVNSGLCKGCTYCCWAYGVQAMPVSAPDGQPTPETYHKLSMEPCPYATETGCRIYESAARPEGCKVLWCPYLGLECGNPGRIRSKHNGQRIAFRIHRPDEFRDVIEQTMDRDIKGLVFPAVPLEVGTMKAVRVIVQTGCVPAVTDGEWHLQMLRNDSDPEAAMNAWRCA